MDNTTDNTLDYSIVPITHNELISQEENDKINREMNMSAAEITAEDENWMKVNSITN